MLPKDKYKILEYKKTLSNKAKLRTGKLNSNYGNYKVQFNYDELYTLYDIEKKTISVVAKIYSVSPATILKYLRKFNIKTRRLGYTINDKIRKKLSVGHKGIKQSYEWRKNISQAMMGEKNHNYKHGLAKSKKYIKNIIRKSLEYKEWRKAVFERDNYTCQKCGVKNGNGEEIYIEAHHIKSYDKYPQLRFAISNGQTLCKKCHLLTL
jgi:hypothetical protein